MNKLLPSLIGLALCSSAVAHAQVYSAWLPQGRELLVTPAYTFQRFDEFWVGRQKQPRLADAQEQHTGLVTFEYGLTDAFALDATLGYTWVHSPALAMGGRDSDEGLIDTSMGARWKFVDEHATTCPLAPTLALRAGGIIEGTYDESFPFSAGDGASGFEVSLLLAKSICPGFGLYGDIGWRIRNHDVPQDLFGSAGVYATWKSVTLSAGYRHIQGLSGPDIGQAPFPEVREIQQNIEAALGVTDKGGRHYQIFYAHTLDGRNTGQKDVVGISVTLPVGLPR